MIKLRKFNTDKILFFNLQSVSQFYQLSHYLFFVTSLSRFLLFMAVLSSFVHRNKEITSTNIIRLPSFLFILLGLISQSLCWLVTPQRGQTSESKKDSEITVLKVQV